METIIAFILANPAADVKYATAAIQILRAVAPIIQKDFAAGLTIEESSNRITENIAALGFDTGSPAGKNFGSSSA